MAMRLDDTLDILARVRHERRVFHHFKDRGALVVLALYVGVDGRRVAEVKRVPRLAGLLRRQPVRDVLARLRGDVVRAEDLLAHWTARPLPYVLTFGTWGSDRLSYRGWHQTTRRGTNLVVRLNFSSQHDHDFRRLLGDDAYDGTRTPHPVDKTGRNTLAWARVDVDETWTEALVEELQSDWVRDAVRVHEGVTCGRRPQVATWEGAVDRATPRRLSVYRERVLAPHARIWSEALLTATLEVLVRDLGVRRVFLHTWRTGNHLKDIAAQKRPPRSLYSELPRRFAFDVTDRPPRFVEKTADGYTRYVLRHRDPSFHVHDWEPEAVREVGRLL
jgi:hypothetical protein